MPVHAKIPPEVRAKKRQNVRLALLLVGVGILAMVVVFGWRLSHRLPAMPQGSVYGSAYLPVGSGPQPAQERTP